MKALRSKFEYFNIIPIVFLASMDTSIQPGNLLNVRTKSAKCTKRNWFANVNVLYSRRRKWF